MLILASGLGLNLELHRLSGATEFQSFNPRSPTMPLQLTVHHGGLPYLHLEVKGPLSLVDHRGVVALAAAICAAAPYRRCLFDFRGQQLNLAPLEELELGAHVGDILGSLEKVAAVVAPELRKGPAERAVQKTGARLRTFTDIDDAKAWLAT